MQHHIFTTGLARKALLGAGAITALAAGPAMADGVSIRPGHNVTVFHNIDMVAVFGQQLGSQTQIDIFRGTHRVATARGTAIDAEGDGTGALETNHGPEGAAQPGDCFDGATPDIHSGDRVVVSNPGGEAGADEAIVDNITIASHTEVARDAVTGGPPVLDDPATIGVDESQPTRREIWVEGVANYVNAAGTETPIPLDTLDSFEFLGPNDNQLRIPPTTVVAGATPGSYIAKFIEGQIVPDRNRNNVSPSAILDQLDEDGHAAGFGHVDPLPDVSMLVDGSGEQAGPAPGCESAPKHASSVGTLSVDELNVANTGVADTELVLSVGGFTAPGAVDPTVVLSDGTTSVPKLVTPSDGGTGQAGFTAEFTKADLAGLQEGDLTAQLFVGGAPVGAAKTVAYDTVAPTFSVNLAEGTYTGPQKLVITGGPVDYQLNGGAVRTYQGVPIDLGIGSHTLVLTSTDDAGNTTTRTLRYTIVPVPAPAPQGGQSAPPALIITPVPLIANSAAAPQASGRFLASARRISAANAKRNGLLARFSAPRGATRATIRVYRSKAGKLTLVGTKRVSVRRGANSVKLDSSSLRRKLTTGLYLVRVELTGNQGKVGETLSQFMRVTR